MLKVPLNTYQQVNIAHEVECKCGGSAVCVEMCVTVYARFSVQGVKKLEWQSIEHIHTSARASDPTKLLLLNK